LVFAPASLILTNCYLPIIGALALHGGYVNHDANKYLNNAKELLLSDDDNSVNYACLELRYCIEAIVYNKLERFKDKIPTNILKTWEPNKAMKMLLKIDELADKNCDIEVNLCNSETPPKDGWLMLGKQNIPTVKWINKNYNKLGQFLHLPEPTKSDIRTPENIKSNLVNLITDLELYSSNSFWVNFPQIDLQDCKLCGETLLFSPKKLKSGDTVSCTSRKCKANYICVPSKQVDGHRLEYKTYDIECLSCKNTIEIAEHLVTQDGNFSCIHCSASYVVKTDYQYAVV
jgi:hypothetical protein